jgi:hypothetical protein
MRLPFVRLVPSDFRRGDRNPDLILQHAKQVALEQSVCQTFVGAGFYGLNLEKPRFHVKKASFHLWLIRFEKKSRSPLARPMKKL